VNSYKRYTVALTLFYEFIFVSEHGIACFTLKCTAKEKSILAQFRGFLTSAKKKNKGKVRNWFMSWTLGSK